MAIDSSMGNCPYCKYPIIDYDTLRTCPGCMVPHHRDCWDDNGGCTTFACKGQAGSRMDPLPADYDFSDLMKTSTPNKIVLELEDLEGLETLPHASQSYSARRSSAKQTGDGLNYKALGNALLTGLIGGALIWLVGIKYFEYTKYAGDYSISEGFTDIFFFSILMGTVLGAAFGFYEGASNKLPFIPALGALAGSTFLGFLGSALGSLSGYLMILAFFGYDHGGDFLTSILARYLYWGFVGTGFGPFLGIANGGGQKVLNGLIGGGMGGFMGGVLFDLIFIMEFTAETGALLALLAFGGIIGTSIATAQELRKDAWLKVVQGATAGKEYVIHKDRLLIGSSPRDDLTLVMDSGVHPGHASISLLPRHGYVIQSQGPPSVVKVNGREVGYKPLKKGDRIAIGNYILIFQEKHTSEA